MEFGPSQKEEPVRAERVLIADMLEKRRLSSVQGVFREDASFRFHSTFPMQSEDRGMLLERTPVFISICTLAFLGKSFRGVVEKYVDTFSLLARELSLGGGQFSFRGSNRNLTLA